jgi:hypothetical protein
MENYIITNYETVTVPQTLKDRYIKRNLKNLEAGRLIKFEYTDFGFYTVYQRPSGIYQQTEYVFK